MDSVSFLLKSVSTCKLVNGRGQKHTHEIFMSRGEEGVKGVKGDTVTPPNCADSYRNLLMGGNTASDL